MECSFVSCMHINSMVVDSRTRDDGVVRRRRRCKTCQCRFTTLEIEIDQVEKWKKASTDTMRAIMDTMQKVVEKL